MWRQFILWVSAVGMLQTVVPLEVFAQDVEKQQVSERAPAAQRGDEDEDDEFNFSWLDPDKKVYVLQNRRYRKKGRFAAYLSGGINLSNPYRSALVGIPRAAYWFTEQFGVEAFYGLVNNSENETLKSLKNATPTALPFVREIRSYFGGVVTWTPWYAKINVFNKILYFDWFFNAGIGQIATRVDQNTRADRPPLYKSDNLFGAFFGTGHNFYLNEHFLVRWDLVGMLYSATASDNRTKNTKTNFDFAVGAGYAF